jgi:chromate transporter
MRQLPFRVIAREKRVERSARARGGQALIEVALLFLRLGATAFGGPAAHIVLIERECVERRRWMTPQQFLDVLGVANLIPGPTSTELAMHIGRLHAGWPGLIVAGVAFILPASLMIGVLAAVYLRAGDIPVARAVSAAVQPVVIVMVLQAIVPLGRSAVRSLPLVVLAVASLGAALAGVPELVVLLAAGAVQLAVSLLPGRGAAALLAAVAAGSYGALLMAAGPEPRVASADVFGYFTRVGSLLFGSGYVLLPVLQGDLVERLGWLTNRELLDAVAAGQATPGPLFTTATFIGYLLGGPATAAVATVAIFLPAFVFSALSSVLLERLRTLRQARAFLDGVNAAAIALIVVAVIMLARTAFAGVLPVAIGVAAALAILVARWNPSYVLLAAAVTGAAWGVAHRA